MKRLCIMGAGSMGMVLGAYISKAGRQVDLIDANKAHVDAMNEKGAHVVGFSDFIVPVTALTPDQMEGIYDIVFIMTKQTYNESVFASIKAHTNEDSIIVTLQNGIPELECAKVFGTKHLLGAPISWGATWLEPGVSKITSPDDLPHDQGGREFLLGSVTGEITEDVKEVKEILELMCWTEVSENIMSIRWTKLWINATFSGMSAVIGGTFGDVIDVPSALRAVTFIGRETVRAAHASGVQLFNMTKGLEINTLLDFDTEEKRKSLEPVYAQLFNGARALKASMFQDLEKGLKTEVDAINGVVCSVGRQYGVPTPACDLVVKNVHEYEAKKCVGTFEAAKQFDSLEV